MSASLHLPLDYEQLPELWQLKGVLADCHHPQPPQLPLTPKQIEASASWIFTRLFVSLGYQARSNNRPGFLSLPGAAQFRASFEPYFGDDCNVIELLEQSGLLKVVSDGGRDAVTGWICELFAHSNPHLAGNFKPPHLTGNVNSRFKASYTNIVHAASQQAYIMGERQPELFKRYNGIILKQQEMEACIVLVRALDRAICDPAAHDKNSCFSDGLIAAASKVTEKYKPETLMPFYYWLANHYENPVIPKTSEEILTDFEKYFGLMGT